MIDSGPNRLILSDRPNMRRSTSYVIQGMHCRSSTMFENQVEKSHILKRNEGGRRPTERSVFRYFSSCWQILVTKWWQNVLCWEIFKQCDSQLLSSIYYFIYIGQQLSSKPSDGQQAEGSSLLSFFLLSASSYSAGPFLKRLFSSFLVYVPWCTCRIRSCYSWPWPSIKAPGSREIDGLDLPGDGCHTLPNATPTNLIEHLKCTKFTTLLLSEKR